MTPIHKEDDKFVYINRDETTPDNLVELKTYLATNGKGLKNLNDDKELRIQDTLNIGLNVRVRYARPVLTKGMIISAIRACDVPTVANIAKACGFKYETVRKRIDRYELWGLIEQIRIESIDQVEDKLLSLAKDGDVRAIKLYLEARAKSRGYGAAKDIPKQDVNVKITFDTPSEVK